MKVNTFLPLDSQRGQNLIYEIPQKILMPLKLAGLEERQTFNLEMDGNFRIFEILFQFYESTLIFQMSSSHHFTASTQIEDLMLVIQISELLDLPQIVEDLVLNTLHPLLSDKNCLYLVHKFYEILSKEGLGSSSAVFFQTFSKILDFWAFNLKFLIKNCREICKDLYQDSPDLMRTIIEKCIIFHITDPYFNSNSIVEFLLKESDFKNPFELLKYEREHSVTSENEYLRETPRQKPTLTWNLTNLSGIIMKETETFEVDKGKYVMKISYIPMQDEHLTVNFTPKIAESNYPKNTIISICTSTVENSIPKEESKTLEDFKYRPVNLHWLVSSSKSLKLIEKIQFENQKELQISVYFKVKHLHGMVMNYISRNMTKLCLQNDIKLLTQEELKVLLHRWDPDTTLSSIAQWWFYNGNESSYNYLWNLDLTKTSIKCLISTIRDYPNMREDSAFRERLYDIGQQSEKDINKFIKKFWADFDKVDGMKEIDSDMVKRPEIGTTSRRYMNSVRVHEKEHNVEQLDQEIEATERKIRMIREFKKIKQQQK